MATRAGPALDRLSGEPDPQRRRLLALGLLTRRLALLYADRIDWGYVRERTNGVPEEAQGVDTLLREAGER